MEVEVSGPSTDPNVERAALLRTARKLFEGSIFVPANVWDGKAQTLETASA